MFGELFLKALITISLIWTLLGAIALIVMLVRDWKNGKLW